MRYGCLQKSHRRRAIRCTIGSGETAMQNIEEIADKLKQLPDEQQDEVADFVDFLLSRLPALPEAERALRETAGIWKGEADGLAFEDTLRQQWERRR